MLVELLENIAREIPGWMYLDRYKLTYDSTDTILVQHNPRRSEHGVVFRLPICKELIDALEFLAVGDLRSLGE